MTSAGGPSLFGSAFLSATLLPGTSEALLSVLWFTGQYRAVELWGWATAGNVLGSCLNREIGAGLVRWLPQRGYSSAQWSKAQRLFGKYGQWSLLFAWLPVIGDPLTVVAGALGIHRGRFALLVGLGKGMRYAVLLALLAAAP